MPTWSGSFVPISNWKRKSSGSLGCLRRSSFCSPARLRQHDADSRADARAWSWGWGERLARDVKYGIRTLLRSPEFAIVSVLVMTLGIGATTSLFTMVRAVLLRPLPFRDSGNLVMLYEHFRHKKGGDGFNAVAPGDYRDWRSQTHGFEDMAAMRGYGGILSGVHSELPEVDAERGRLVESVSAARRNSRPGPQLHRGRRSAERRACRPAHLEPVSTPLCGRSFHHWQTDSSGYNSDDRRRRTAQWFTYADARIQFWLPYAQTFSESDYGIHDGHQSEVMARLKPGVSAEAATHEVSALQYRIHLANASKPVAEDVWSRPMIDDLVKGVKTQMLVLLCAVTCMLLIACLNVSNLLVARSAARRKEVAIRGSLGGGRLASDSRADDGKPADLRGGRGPGPAAVARFHALARGQLAQSIPGRVGARRWMGVQFCRWAWC